MGNLVNNVRVYLSNGTNNNENTTTNNNGGGNEQNNQTVNNATTTVSRAENTQSLNRPRGGSNELSVAQGHANSRLNLINQLTTFANGRKKSSKNNCLNDFQNVSFAAHFFMAGRKFKNIINQAQTFLFGDQLDLGFILSHKAILFPYEISSVDMPSNYLQSLVNIRKDTLKLVKFSNLCESAPTLNKNNEPINSSNLNAILASSNEAKYNIEFVFDCDCDVTIRIHYFATEHYALDGSHSHSQGNQASSSNSNNKKFLNYVCGCSRFNLNYMSDNSINQINTIRSSCFCLNDDSQPVVYKKGANIVFKQPNHILTPSKFHSTAWQFNLHSNYFPIVIECRPVDEHLRDTHAHVTLAYIEKLQQHPVPSSQAPSNGACGNDSATSGEQQQQNQLSKAFSTGCIPAQINYVYQLKPIKQKQLIDGVVYCLQEIYGIEKKSANELSPELVSSEIGANAKGVVNKSLSNRTQQSITSETTTTTSSSLSTTTITSNENFEPTTGVVVVGGAGGDDEREQELKGIECVICMCELRDTLILPCRHFCLCKMCAINLRVQSNNCPICRIPFLALVQMKLYRKKAEKHPHKQSAVVKKVDETNNRKKQPSERQLPEIKLNDLNSINVSAADDVENFIQIEHRIESAGCEREKPLKVNCEIKNANQINGNSHAGKKYKLTDFYDSLNIFEVYNGIRQTGGFQSVGSSSSSSCKRAKKSSSSDANDTNRRAKSCSSASKNSTRKVAATNNEQAAAALTKIIEKPTVNENDQPVELSGENQAPKEASEHENAKIEIHNMSDLKAELDKILSQSISATVGAKPLASCSVIVNSHTGAKFYADATKRMNVSTNKIASKSLDDIANDNNDDEQINLDKLNPKTNATNFTKNKTNAVNITPAISNNTLNLSNEFTNTSRF